MNTEFARYAAVTIKDVLVQAEQIFRMENLNVMYYRSKPEAV